MMYIDTLFFPTHTTVTTKDSSTPLCQAQEAMESLISTRVPQPSPAIPFSVHNDRTVSEVAWEADSGARARGACIEIPVRDT